YWTLKYLQQNGITELTATAFKDNLVRADDLPLVLPAAGAQGLPRGAKVRIRLGDIDEITLDVNSTVVERLDVVVDDAAAEQVDEEDNESEIAAGPISIAVDLNEAPAENAPVVGGA
ncbi:MAG: RNB domain-containing ribonuclease, partial [Haliea sp.]